jgi:8-oxo-dGTP diphosphatase
MADKVTRFVVGFLFDDKDNVALINKTHPEWQRGKLNGIGGHMEFDESPLNAMIREFKEEANLEVSNWNHYCTLSYSGDCILYFFTANILPNTDIKSNTEEIVDWYPLKQIGKLNVIPNLRWLIPMAKYNLTHEHVFATISGYYNNKEVK